MPNRKLNAALELFSQREKQEIRWDDLGEGEGGGGEQIVDLNIHSNALVSVFSINKIKKEIIGRRKTKRIHSNYMYFKKRAVQI